MANCLYAKVLGVFTLNAVALAGHRLMSDKSDWLSWARAEGTVPMHQMKVLCRAVDRVPRWMLGKLNAAPHVQAEAAGCLPTDARRTGSTTILEAC